MDARETLLKEIADLEKLIKARRDMLRVLDKAERQAGAEKKRFSNMRALAAMKIVLSENGGSMPYEDLKAALLEGGFTDGMRRAAHHSIRLSRDISVKHGSLLYQDGIVSLPANDTSAST